MSRKRPLRSVASLTLAVAALGLAACGGSGSGETVAQVGGSAITRTAVSHWMSTLGGGDYYELSGSHTLPAGLISDPPNYSRCVSTLEAASAASAHTDSTLAAALTPTELLRKCRELNLALRTQATAYLVAAQWQAAVDRDEGITATEQEVQQLFEKVKAEQYPTAADLSQYLASHRSNLADFLFILKLDVLQSKAGSKLTGGDQQTAVAFSEAGRRWTAKTSCSAGYVVMHCKQFNGSQTYPGTLPPSILMEQVAALVTGRCINQAACGKQ
jgi:hypothetical protein